MQWGTCSVGVGLVCAIRGVDNFVIVGGWDVVKYIYADILPQNTISRGSHIDVAWRSICDRDQNGIK